MYRYRMVHYSNERYMYKRDMPNYIVAYMNDLLLNIYHILGEIILWMAWVIPALKIFYLLTHSHLGLLWKVSSATLILLELT